MHSGIACVQMSPLPSEKIGRRASSGLTSGNMSAFELPCAKLCLTFFRPKKETKPVILSKKQLFIWKEISRHRAKGPPNKQWYISAEVRRNRSWKVTFSAKVDGLSTIWRLGELDNTCKYNAWSCIFFDIVHVILDKPHCRLLNKNPCHALNWVPNPWWV